MTAQQNNIYGIYIKNYFQTLLQMNNYSGSEKDALEFIKKRLLEEDYRQIEGILNQYLDLV